MKDLLDYIQESLYQDLCYTYNVIDESGGLYDGQIDLAAKITNDIVNHNDNIMNHNCKQDFTLTYANVGLNNEYFNKLIVDVNLWRKTSVNASIDLYGNLESDDPYKKYNYDKSSDKLDIVTITISCNYDTSIYSDVIMSRISHELNHGYVYWQTIKDDFKENDKTVPEEIHSKLHEWSNTIYKKIASNIINPTNDEASQIAYNLIYTLTRYERNAFLTEIVTYLYDNNGKLKDIDNAKQLLSKSSQYRLYAEEGPEIIDIMKNEWDDKRQDTLRNAYNTIYNTNYTTSKVLKIIEHKLEETIKKINHNITTICRKLKDGYDIEENLHYMYLPNKIQWF